MVVVSDTSPLYYLIVIGEADILQTLFHEVRVPPIVVKELTHENAPAAVREWALAIPEWVKVISPTQVLNREDLDVGERSALALALELRAERVLVDDLAARKACRSLGLKPFGTLGILAEASRLGLVRLDDAIARLLATNFRASPALVNVVLSGKQALE